MAWDWLVQHWRILFVVALALVAMVLFFTEVFPIEVTSLGILVTLAFSQLVSIPDAFSGFSNPATLTVLMMFILSGAVIQTGLIDILTTRLERIFGESTTLQVLIVVLLIGPLSAFINNTAAVAVFIPLVVHLASKAGRSPSKILMPLSFAAMLGGTMTLIGTSTNLLGSEVRAQAALGSFEMFEFTKAGLIVYLVGSTYLVLLGHRLVPRRVEGRPLDERYGLREFVFKAEIQEKSPLVGQPVASTELYEEYDAEILALTRGNHKLEFEDSAALYAPGDAVVLRTTRDNLQRMADRGLVQLVTVQGDKPVELETARLAEVFVHSESAVRGRVLGQLDLFSRHRVRCVALLSRGRSHTGRLYAHRLRTGDVLLVEGQKHDLAQLTGGQDFHVLGGPAPPLRRPHRIPHVLFTLAAVVGIAALGWAPIVLTATAGVVLLVMMGALRLDQLYRSIHWDVIFMLAGLIPLGIAFAQTGAAQAIASFVAATARVLPPLGILMLVFLATSLMTEVISNNASVILLAPIALELAAELSLNPITLLLAVMFAASTSFLTPLGYQTNLMVMAPGGYRYRDYFLVGAPLNVLMVVTTPFVLNFFFPLV